MSAHLRQLYTTKIVQQSTSRKIKELQKVFQNEESLGGRSKKYLEEVVSWDIEKNTTLTHYRKEWKTGTDHVHVKTDFDKKYFRYVMPATYLSLVGSFGLFFYMALGKMKRASK